VEAGGSMGTHPDCAYGTPLLREDVARLNAAIARVKGRAK
jgi:hypothetical protein